MEKRNDNVKMCAATSRRVAAPGGAGRGFSLLSGMGWLVVLCLFFWAFFAVVVGLLLWGWL